MAFTYRDMGRTFHEHILRVFGNDWMDCSDAFHYLCNGQNIAEYETYLFRPSLVYSLFPVTARINF